MTHALETMFYVGAEPWHGLGKKLDAPPTSAEAIVMAGLDWRVEAQPIFAEKMQSPLLKSIDGPNEMIVRPDSYVAVPEGQVVRRMSDGKTLGVVGPRWTPVQNRDAFNFFDPLVQDGLAIYHTAGALQGGKTVWILAQIGESRNIIGDDRVGQFLLLSMGHDGKRAVQIMPTPIRVVCANTLNMAEGGAEAMIKVAHTANATTRLDQIQGFIRPHLLSFDATMEMFQVLARAQAGVPEVDTFLKTLFPDPTDPDANTSFAERVRREILAKFEGDLMGYDAIPAAFQRSYWTLYNSVTEYVDHDRGSDNHRLNSAWFGSGNAVKSQALELVKVAVA